MRWVWTGARACDILAPWARQAARLDPDPEARVCMSKPFVFHFSLNADEVLCAMVVLDLEAFCGVCGYQEMQRFYGAEPFHALNVARWERLVRQAPSRLGYRCSNCNAPVGPEAATRGALTYGFCDGLGVLQSLFVVREGEGREAVHTLQEDKRLDVQALPRWEVEEGHERELIHPLSEDSLYARLKRPLSLKAAWRSLLRDHAASGEGLWEAAAAGVWLCAAASAKEEARLLEHLPDPRTRARLAQGELARVGLLDAPPPQEGFWDAGLRQGAAPRWLDPKHLDGLQAGRVVAAAYLDPRLILRELTRALELARLTFEVEGEGLDARVHAIKTPRDVTYPASLKLADLARCAAHTAVTPTEAGRIAAEGVVADLLGLRA